MTNTTKKTTPLRENYDWTLIACFVGYITQAIVNNFLPLLFVFFQRHYGIPLAQITFLITFNFGLQLTVDAVSAKFIDRIGYRAAGILAHVCAGAGLILLTILPGLTPTPFTGLLISVMVYAVGGGLLEVMVSPVVEACPTHNKEMAMSLLHSFYCWGQVAVVGFSTLFFMLAGVENWRIMALIWSLIPLLNIALFAQVPIAPLLAEDEEELGLMGLLRSKLFWILVLMMVAAGASELAMSQWASAFAEEALGVSKTVGDLAGPMFFGILMGSSRALFGHFGEKMDLEKFMSFSAVLCFLCYITVVFVPNPVVSLLACGVCGFSVGIFWPGTFSVGTGVLKGGGTLMFALFALGGDIGCMSGPTLAGRVAAAAGDDLKRGLLAAAIFPVLMLIGIYLRRRELSRV